MPQYLAYGIKVACELVHICSCRMPLRYNKDKRKNPVFSRVSGRFIWSDGRPFFCAHFQKSVYNGACQAGAYGVRGSSISVYLDQFWRYALFSSANREGFARWNYSESPQNGRKGVSLLLMRFRKWRMKVIIYSPFYWIIRLTKKGSVTIINTGEGIWGSIHDFQ